MISGAIIVAPAIATLCWRPDIMVCPHGRRSSGMITPPFSPSNVGNSRLPDPLALSST
jgi:hypothetical protein